MAGRKQRLAGLLAFIQSETAGGIVLVIAALVAVAWANSPFGGGYDRLLHLRVALGLGAATYSADLQYVVDDGLMAVFFLLVGLEIRREVTQGQLASRARASAPLVAALGGMMVPAAIYVACARGDAAALRGWAVPVATDIAFSLAVLRLLGRRVPAGLRVFLTALAIIDDLGAILVIAVFYTARLDLPALAAASVVWLALFALGRAGFERSAPYLAGFGLLWVFTVRSGVHPTLAGVALAAAVPMAGEHSVGRRLERGLNRAVAFVVLPLFGLANAGLHVASLSWHTLRDPVVPGIVLGLFLGKQLGVFGSTWLACRLRLIALPERLSWEQLYGGAALCGIGFTMSLFIGALSFDQDTREAAMKVSVFAASLLSATLGAAVLLYATRRRAKAVASQSAKGASPSQSSVKS